MCTTRSNALAERCAHTCQAAQSTLRRRRSAFRTLFAGALVEIQGQAAMHCRSTVPGETRGVSSWARRKQASSLLLPPLWLLGSSRGPPVLPSERNNPRRVSSSHTRRCRRRRMTIQVAGAAAVRRRRLIDIYGLRTIQAAGWLAGYPARPSKGCVYVCMCVRGALGAREPQGHRATSLARCTARQAVGC